MNADFFHIQLGIFLSNLRTGEIILDEWAVSRYNRELDISVKIICPAIPA